MIDPSTGKLTIEPTVDKLSDQNYADVQEAALQGNRANAEIIRIGAGSTAKVVDVVAASAMLQNALPNAVLAARTASGQPQQLPTGVRRSPC